MGNGLPSPSYRVETPVPLSDTQNGPVGPSEMPQGLTRFGSVCLAGTEPSETRLVCSYWPNAAADKQRVVTATAARPQLA